MTNIGLYTAAQWAMPILSHLPVEQKASFLVTSSLLWKQPYAPFFSLSMVKSSQRTLVQCLGATFPGMFLLRSLAHCLSPQGTRFRSSRCCENGTLR